MSKLLLASVFVLGTVSAAFAQPPAASPAPAADLKVGDKAPDFTLPGTDGKTHHLADYKGKTVVLGWYPAAFTGGCTAECKSFRDAGEAIKSYDVVYFMASVDTPEKNADFAKQEEANFPMLSDPDKKVAMSYGVVPMSGEGRAQRWTFYIGADGKIEFIDKMVNAELKEIATDTTCTTDCGPGPKLAAKLAELKVKKAK